MALSLAWMNNDFEFESNLYEKLGILHFYNGNKYKAAIYHERSINFELELN